MSLLREEFDRLTFNMPGWSFETWDDPMFQVLTLVLKGRVRNTYDPDDPTLTQVQHRWAVPPFLSASQVPHFFRDCVHAALMHEADEWIRYDGVLMFDPHAVGQR